MEPVSAREMCDEYAAPGLCEPYVEVGCTETMISLASWKGSAINLATIGTTGLAICS